MLDSDLTAVVGTPNANVTHWGISRVQTRGGQSSLTRLDHPRADGARTKEWEVEELDLETVKERWGAGSFKVHWFRNDPDNADPNQRRLSGGHGPVFTLDPDPAPEVSQPVQVPVSVPFPSMPAGTTVAEMLSFAQSMMAMTEARANQTIQAITSMRDSGGGGNAAVLAEVASLKAQLAADQAMRVIEDRHREAMAEKDREIERLRRQAEDAERNDGPAPLFEPGTPFLEQLPTLLANTVGAFVQKNPEQAAAVGAAIYEKVAAAKAAPAAVPPPAPPQPVAPRTFRPVVVPRSAGPSTLTPEETARAADPVPSVPSVGTTGPAVP